MADAKPATQPFWETTTNANGELNWEVQDGDWTVVVMNADGSAGVKANVEAGANVPILDDIGWVLLTLGGLGMAGAAALIITGATRR